MLGDTLSRRSATISERLTFVTVIFLPWADVETKAARTRGRITRCREDRLAGLEIRVFNGRGSSSVDA
jgi:hypothetical protein